MKKKTHIHSSVPEAVSVAKAFWALQKTRAQRTVTSAVSACNLLIICISEGTTPIVTIQNSLILL